MIISTVQNLWLFQDNLNESAQDNNLSQSSSDPLIYGTRYFYDLINRKLISDKTIYLSDSLSTSVAPFSLGSTGNEMSIAFWYYSSENIGFINKSSQQSYVVPIIASSNYISNGVTASPTALQFKLEEVAHSDSSNKLLLSISDVGSTVSGTMYSSPYESGKWHHIVLSIKYGPTAGKTTARIDLDNIVGPDFVISSGIYSVFSTFWINKYVGPGNLSSVKNPEAGQLSELIVFSNYSGQERALRLTKYGYLFSCDSNYIWTRIDELGLSQTNPLTISTIKIVNEGQTVYVLRSDGEILKGQRPLWDAEFIYKTPDSFKNLDIIKSGDSGFPVWTPDGISLKGTVIRA